MSGSLVADLGIGAGSWLFLTLLACLTLFFKFSRVWSIRNLDLFLMFALAPGIMQLVANPSGHPWQAYVWLFVGSTLWLARCVLDLILTRRPMLEPNLNAAGLACVAVGLLGMMVVETVSLPMDEGTARNPADPSAKSGHVSATVDSPRAKANLHSESVGEVLKLAPLPGSMKRELPQVILRRVLASLAHLGMVAALIFVGWKHFDRPITGLAIAACYLLTPYTRIAIVDSGQLVPAALIVTAVACYTRPMISGSLIGLASGWMPACLGLIALWAGFYRGRGSGRFLLMSLVVLFLCATMGLMFPPLAHWAQAFGARNLSEAGLLSDGSDAPAGSFWSGIDPSYRQPVLIAYLALVLVTSFYPAEKNLGELIALSGALLVATQFWYLDEGGTLVILYLPVILLMMFRPNLSNKRPPILSSSLRRARQAVQWIR
ncbi:hypothetical protein EP7_000740 [Isosphaeraceae bacterium EP7]